MATYTGLLSLPDELLFRIFGLLKDKELYKHIGTCHTFHNISLHIIFSRHHPRISSGKVYIQSLNSPTFLLPAIRDALFLHDLHDISIIFASQISKLFEEMRVLTEIVGRMKRNTRLSLNLKRVEALFGPWYLSPNRVATLKTQYDHEQLADGLKNLMDAALKKGCTTLRLISASEALRNELVILKIRLARQRQLRLLEERKREIEQRRLGFLRRLRNVFFKSWSSTTEESNTSPADASGSSSSNTEHPMVPTFPPHLGLFSSQSGDPPSSRSLTITGPLIVAPFFLSWTLSLLNYGSFTKLSLNLAHFDDDPWHDILPKIRMVNLKEFTLQGDKINPYDLAVFLQRHSDTLEDISLSMSRSFHQSKWIQPPGVAESGLVPAPSSFSSLTPDPTPDPLYLDFPVLRHLELISYHIPWFLDSIISNPKATKHLPNLSALTISLLRDRPQVPNLDHVFESISKLVNLGTSESRCTDWLSSLKLNGKGVKPSVFLDSLNSYTRKPLTDTGTNGLSKPRRVFPTVQDLHLEFRHISPDLDIFNPLLRLLALFPNVKHLALGSIRRDALRMREGAYWEEVRVRCPELDEVVFEDFHHLPAKMDDLAKGKYPCVFV
ncbi:hypothetical protein BDN72DRAFT_896022 [Pluteus cervinus]|uniref:Uncharacterized protein n=1 Tax=Pluteus cervinus TaxID=181527 RepID=A0ACD3AYV9_9AGAR|nr:hypothetical protein BDN72DRAFT_896022 [Pluteus cervinus]